jgi:hypothetical protein
MQLLRLIAEIDELGVSLSLEFIPTFFHGVFYNENEDFPVLVFSS